MSSTHTYSTTWNRNIMLMSLLTENSTIIYIVVVVVVVVIVVVVGHAKTTRSTYNYEREFMLHAGHIHARKPLESHGAEQHINQTMSAPIT
jgi:hypothetical protein